MSSAQRDQAILERLKVVTQYAYENSSFYRRRWDEAGFHPEQLRSLEDFEDRVPVITKPDLRASQAEAPPFGDYLCIPRNDVFRIHGTSGTTGTPTATGMRLPMLMRA
jgi:phenylacetate-CoA ligase